MKLIDMVEELVSQGHKIKFRYRTDGGIIITSIDGKKFTSLTEGNKTARSMVEGGELSMARAEQVKFNVNKYIKLKKGEHKAKGKIEDVLDKQLKQTQKEIDDLEQQLDYNNQLIDLYESEHSHD